MRALHGSGPAFGPSLVKSRIASVRGSNTGHAVRPSPFGSPVFDFAKLVQYAFAAAAAAASFGVSFSPYFASTVSNTYGISVACIAPGHSLRSDSATYEKR